MSASRQCWADGAKLQTTGVILHGHSPSITVIVEQVIKDNCPQKDCYAGCHKFAGPTAKANLLKTSR